MAQRVLLLDGGLATELEAAGHDLDHPLWSARLLAADPSAIQAVHRAFRDAGADVVTSASYQVSRLGLEEGELASAADAMVAESVLLAREAAPGALIAASLGSFAATLHDGSEYTGTEERPAGGLEAFWAPRLEAALAASPDVVALETMPSVREAEIAVRLLAERAPPGLGCWVSCTLADPGSEPAAPRELRTAAGEPLAELAALAEAEIVLAVGLNCGPPARIAEGVEELRRHTDAPLVAYPNRGERYDPEQGWIEGSGGDPVAVAERLLDAGVRLLGGCCRTTPDDTRRLRALLDRIQSPA